MQLREEINLLKNENERLHKTKNIYLCEKEELGKNIRALKILSDCNHALIRARDEKSLLDNICRIIIDQGGYKFVWIGYSEDEKYQSIEPASFAGIENGYLTSIHSICSKGELDSCPACKAILEHKPQIIKDISTESDYSSWKKLAIDKGFSSLITFPLIKDKSCFGTLNIYSDKKNSFEETEINLLAELSDDIAFGISSLRTLAEKEKIAVNLKESEERIRSLFENAAIGIYRTSIDGKFLMANPELIKILGYDSFEELASIRVKDAYVEKNERNKFLEIAFTQKTIPGFETELKRKDGSKINVRINGRLLKNESLNQQYIEGTLEDITAKKEIEKHLITAKKKAEEMNRLKDNFLANMSHELRTPMVGILGFSEILLNTLDETNHKEIAESIYYSGKRLMETLDSILDLSKIEANKIKLNMIKVNLNDQVRDVIASNERLAGKRQLYLKHEIKDENINSILDIQFLKKILNNLVNNALKYTNSGGVTVEVNSIFENRVKWAVIKVIDTGIGIPKQSQNIIFEDFRQLSEGLNRKYEGSGLGLSLTKRFAELMGGKLELESKIDYGSTFTLKFPVPNENKSYLSKGETGIKEIKKQDELQDHSGIMPDILIVDNDMITLDITRIMLRNLCNIEYALSGNEALKKVSGKIYSAILMDINLGSGMNGMEVTKEIRKIPAYRNVPIIACTAYAMSGDKERFIGEGCTHYISKPFSKENIRNLIKEILKT